METPTNATLTPAQRLLRLLHLHRRTINLVLLYALFIGIINLSLPLGIQAIIGLLMGGSISAAWALLTLVVLAGLLFSGYLRYLQLSATETMQQQLLADAAFDFAVRIPYLNLEKLRREHLPELINRFFDTLTLQKGLPKILTDGSAALLQIMLSLLVVSFYHPVFLAFSVGLLLLLGLLFWLTFSEGTRTSLVESKYKYQIAYWLEEIGRVADTFKLIGSTRMPVQRTDKLVSGYLDARKKHFRVLLIQFASSLFLRLLTVGGFLIMGSILVMENVLNLGQFVAAEILVLLAVESLEKVVLMMSTLYDILTATEKLGQFTDLPIESRNGLSFGEACPEKRVAIEWRNLSHQFPDSDTPTLSNLNLSIPASEKVAIVGYNRSGKSTLMQINSVLIREFSGALLFNGLPANSLQLDSLRENIGDLSSQEDIFKGSIMDNILIGRDEIPLARVLTVVEQVGLHHFVQRLPDGLNTELLPGGKGLPGSVKTKILVARAIVAEPSVLVLEDPIGSLDYRDRLNISQLLTDKKQTWTMLCVTEDPLLAAMCDRVVVLKNGEIVAVGTFSDIRQTEHFDKIFRASEPGES